MMSGTKMFELWLLILIALAAIFFFVSGWMLERKQRKENPAGPRDPQGTGRRIFSDGMLLYRDDNLHERH